MRASDLTLLSAPFAHADIEWKPGATTRDKSKGLAMAYLTSRAVQDRLDAVCGPGDWRNEFREGPGGGVLCGLSVRVEREDGSAEWITKWDGADNTDVEAVKGGLSGSMKRAAVQWGVGRYLYDLPAQWVRLDDRGRFAEAPRIPSEHLPPRDRGASRPSTAAPPAAEAPVRREAGRSEAARPTPAGGNRRVIRRAGASGDGAERDAEPRF